MQLCWVYPAFLSVFIRVDLWLIPTFISNQDWSLLNALATARYTD